jgi:hypothetical protein
MIQRVHIVVTAILAIALVPIFRSLQIPIRFTWGNYVTLYWVYLAIESLILAIVLYVVGATGDFLRSLQERGPKVDFPVRQVKAILVPAAYFFVVFFLVLSFNVVIAAIRFNGSADVMLARIDSFLLGGGSVSAIAHWAGAHLSGGSLRLLEKIYFGMFPQIGACLVLLAMKSGLKESFKFISAVTVSYYLALALFLIIPATGPFYGSREGLGVVSDGRTVPLLQGEITGILNNFRDHHMPDEIALDYFIALPCMHLVQPLIILWFLRRWGRVFWILLVYDLVLVASIILLQQHYVVDLVAAIPGALFAVAWVDRAAAAEFWGVLWQRRRSA